MSSVFTRAATCAVAVTAAITGTTAPARAAETVSITAHEVFEGGSTFTSDIDGCGSGAVSDMTAQVHFAPRFGKYNGFKLFECAGGGSFVVRLTAKFDDSGSTGTWAIVGGTDGFEDLRGAGSLVGTPAPPDGITDQYDGTLRP